MIQIAPLRRSAMSAQVPRALGICSCIPVRRRTAFHPAADVGIVRGRTMVPPENPFPRDGHHLNSQMAGYQEHAFAAGHGRSRCSVPLMVTWGDRRSSAAHRDAHIRRARGQLSTSRSGSRQSRRRSSGKATRSCAGSAREKGRRQETASDPLPIAEARSTPNRRKSPITV